VFQGRKKRHCPPRRNIEESQLGMAGESRAPPQPPPFALLGFPEGSSRAAPVSRRLVLPHRSPPPLPSAPLLGSGQLKDAAGCLPAGALAGRSARGASSQQLSTAGGCSGRVGSEHGRPWTTREGRLISAVSRRSRYDVGDGNLSLGRLCEARSLLPGKRRSSRTGPVLHGN
jgi:hypothetical protein